MMKRVFFILMALVLMAVGAMANLSDGLVAHYEFEGNANDSSGNGNNGTEHGGVSYVTGKIGQAASFDGIDDYIQTNKNPLAGIGSEDFTISLWFKLKDVGINWLLFLGKNLVGGEYRIASYIKDDSKVYADIGDYSSSPSIASLSSISQGTWYHVLHIKKNGTHSIYLNGILQESRPNNTALNSNEFAKSMTIGIRPGNWDYPLNGLIDDLRIYNRALSSTEIQELYSGSTCNDRYNEGYTAGKQYCISNPSACGITTGATTVVSSEDDISIAIKSDWQLVGVSGSIKVSDFSSFFDSSCVSEVYYFNGSWYHYIPGSTSGQIDIGPDQGFWVKGKKSCTLTNLRYTREQCNLSYPSLSTSDKAWCDSHYY